MLKTCEQCGEGFPRPRKYSQRQWLAMRVCSWGCYQGRRIEPVRERLARFSIPEPNSGCVLWLGDTNKGYGVLWDGKKRLYAHRLAYEVAIGPIPDGLDVDHLCSTTACLNPEHLDPVTRSENSRRRWVRYRAKGICKNGHLRTEGNLTSNGRCLTCRRKAQRDYVERRLAPSAA